MTRKEKFNVPENETSNEPNIEMIINETMTDHFEKKNNEMGLNYSYSGNTTSQWLSFQTNQYN